MSNRSAANYRAYQQQQQYAPPPSERARRGMARRDYGSGDAREWERDWRAGVDTDIADLQRQYIQAAQTMVEVKQWIINHDQRHADDRQQRSQAPSEWRGWISTAISIFTLLLMLYLQSQH